MPTDDIANAVLAEWKSAQERLLASKIGQEVERLETAYVALTGVGRPDFFFKTEDPAAIAQAKSKRTRSGSIRSLVETALVGQERLWSYEDLATFVEAGGGEIRDDDGKIKSSLRTAVWTLVKENVARRGPNGTVFATQHSEALESRDQLDRNTMFPPFSKEDVEGD